MEVPRNQGMNELYMFWKDLHLGPGDRGGQSCCDTIREIIVNEAVPVRVGTGPSDLINLLLGVKRKR